MAVRRRRCTAWQSGARGTRHGGSAQALIQCARKTADASIGSSNDMKLDGNRRVESYGTMHKHELALQKGRTRPNARSSEFVHPTNGAPYRIRTYDLGIRSPLLYPAELTAHEDDYRPKQHRGTAENIGIAIALAFGTRNVPYPGSQASTWHGKLHAYICGIRTADSCDDRFWLHLQQLSRAMAEYIDT